MTDPFDLPIHYRGADQLFIAQLVLHGFSHRFKVIVYDQEVFFEPDEEGKYRVISVPGQNQQALERIPKDLFEAIGQKISEILS